MSACEWEPFQDGISSLHGQAAVHARSTSFFFFLLYSFLFLPFISAMFALGANIFSFTGIAVWDDGYFEYAIVVGLVFAFSIANGISFALPC